MAKTGYDDELRRALDNAQASAAAHAQNLGLDRQQAVDRRPTAAQPQTMPLITKPGQATAQPQTMPYITRPGQIQAQPQTMPYKQTTGIADALQKARQAAVNSVMGQPATYDAYGALADKKMQEVQNTKGFSYNFNADPMFKMLSNSYMNQARQAANNASAMEAARTGGYGNSYGAMAAGQQYNQALQNLYDQVPELQQAAYERYLNDRNDLYKQADYYANRGDTLWNRNYQQTEADREDSRWNKQFDANRSDTDWSHRYQESEAAREQGNWERQYNDSRRDYEDETAYARAQDAYNRQRAEEQTDYDRAQDAYNKQRAEEETAYDRYTDEYNRRNAMAQYLASLGNYEAAEALSGYDLNQARRTDDLNMALQIIGAVGYDKALPLIQQLLGVNGLSALATSSSKGGSSGGGRSSGKSSSGGTTTASAPTVTQTETTPKETSMPGVYDVTELWDQLNRNRRR